MFCSDGRLAERICAPCGHLIACLACAQCITGERPLRKCEICQNPVQGCAEVFPADQCVVCLDYSCDTVILPCGHQCSCFPDAARLWGGEKTVPHLHPENRQLQAPVPDSRGRGAPPRAAAARKKNKGAGAGIVERGEVHDTTHAIRNETATTCLISRGLMVRESFANAIFVWQCNCSSIMKESFHSANLISRRVRHSKMKESFKNTKCCRALPTSFAGERIIYQCRHHSIVKESFKNARIAGRLTHRSTMKDWL
jgi:hypothetical protein